MNLVGGYPFWLLKSGLLYNYPALERSVKTDVVIIGGGISGALTAYHLINAGVKCIIVDARTIGLGSTCASTSLLQYELDLPICKLKNKVGLQNAVTAYKLGEKAIVSLIEIDKDIRSNELQRKKSLYYAANKKHTEILKEEVILRKQNGFKVDYLNKDEAAKQFDINVPGALLTKYAAQTDAYKFTHSLHQASKREGLEIYDRTCVISIIEDKRSFILTTENGCKIKSKRVVYANGYEATTHLDKNIVDLYSTYATVSQQFPSTFNFWKDDVLIWNSADPYLYMRTTNDKRIIVGGRDVEFIQPLKRDALLRRKTILLKNDFRKLFPAIPFKDEFSWTGVFASTKDGLPFIGEIKGKPNQFFALGFGGNGIVFSQVAAKIITDFITKGKSKHGKLFSFDRI
ncbi:MAG: FAD-binding oxidoreductase [Bacteroidota bacterium]